MVCGMMDTELEVTQNIDIHDASSFLLYLYYFTNIYQLVETAFNILGQDGQIPLAQKHECSECTQPFKPCQGQDAPENALPVKMIVMDGIVMGPTVFFLFNIINL